MQSSDEPRRHYVVYVASDSCLFEIHSACLNLTLPTQSWRPQTAPSFPQWRAPWPLSIHAAPTYWPLLGTEARPAVQACGRGTPSWALLFVCLRNMDNASALPSIRPNFGLVTMG